MYIPGQLCLLVVPPGFLYSSNWGMGYRPGNDCPALSHLPSLP